MGAMRDMVKRDRNHPSIVVWSFCNEYECQQNDPDFSATAYRNAAYSVDGTRPVTANDITYGSPAFLDVQGGSHSKNDTFAKYHEQYPKKPLVLPECCSCSSQRPDRDLPSCIADENSPGLGQDIAGSLGVWTLMDYFGEPHGTGVSGWPFVSCDFGQFDIAGFPKPHAYWYNVNWLQAYSKTNPGRPPLPSRNIVHLLSLLQPGGLQSASEVSGITTAPFAELFLNGFSQGVIPTPKNDLGEFEAVVWNITNRNGKATPVVNSTLVGLSAAKGGIIMGSQTILAAQMNKGAY